MLSEGELTPAADVYSVGVCLWEMYTGTRAWCGQHPAQVILAITTGRGALPLPQGTPASFRALVEACMAADRGARPTALQLLEQVRGMLAAGS